MKMMSANRLTDGEAVWLDHAGEWVTSIQDGMVASTEGEISALEGRAASAVAANRVVDTELIDVDLVNERPMPKRLRERIRALGPTTHPHLGKQAGGDVDLPAIG